MIAELKPYPLPPEQPVAKNPRAKYLLSKAESDGILDSLVGNEWREVSP